MTTDTVGGVWSFSLDLAKGILDAGSLVALVSLGRLPSDQQRASCAAIEAEYKDRFCYGALDVPLEWMSDNDGAYQQAAPALLAISKEFAPDVLHSNQFCFGALPVPIPKLITAHSDVLSWARSCRDSVLEDTPWLRTYRHLVQSGLVGASAVTTPTSWMLDSLLETYSLPSDRRVIANGCSVPVLANSNFKMQAVTAGRVWDEGKGINLFKDVRSPIPLLVAGETTHDCLDTPMHDCHSCNFLGALERQDLISLFSRSAVYICPSIYEPFGLAPLEAAMCGCAILARDIPSLREVWGEGALYFHDAASLSTLLHRLYANPALLRQLRTASRVRASSFSLSLMTEAYLELYANLKQDAASRAHAA